MISHCFDARNEPFDHVRQWLDAYCSEAKVGEQQAWQLQLAVEEFFANSVKHGYRGAPEPVPGAWPIWIMLTHDAGGVHLLYEDAAYAFDPLLDMERPDYSGPAETWQIGGLGLPMVAAIAQDLRYERVNGRNRLQLTLPAVTEARETIPDVPRKP